MLGWALTFLILALVAGYMGFFGLAGLAASIAKLLLVVFVILLIVSAFSGAPSARPPVWVVQQLKCSASEGRVRHAYSSLHCRTPAGRPDRRDSAPGIAVRFG